MLLRHIKLNIHFVLALFLLVGCGADKKKVEENVEAAAIKVLKTSLDSIDNRKDAVPTAEKLYRELLVYIDKHPKDTLSPKFLYVAAQLNESYLGDYPQAFAHYHELTDQFPDSRFTPYALFMKGVIMERYFKQSDKAVFYLDEYIKKYPNHKMVDMAQQMMETSGIDAADLVKRFNTGADQTKEDNKQE